MYIVRWIENKKVNTLDQFKAHSMLLVILLLLAT